MWIKPCRRLFLAFQQQKAYHKFDVQVKGSLFSTVQYFVQYFSPPLPTTVSITFHWGFNTVAADDCRGQGDAHLLHVTVAFDGLLPHLQLHELRRGRPQDPHPGVPLSQVLAQLPPRGVRQARQVAQPLLSGGRLFDALGPRSRGIKKTLNIQNQPFEPFCLCTTYLLGGGGAPLSAYVYPSLPFTPP